MKRGCPRPATKVKANPEVNSAEKLGNNATAGNVVSKPWFDEKTELADDLDYAKVLRLP